MKILVCIASHGNGNDRYLDRLLAEYAAMPHEVQVVVLSNVRKTLPPGVELALGAPTRNPWSLPFAHRPIFADRRHDYDLFIYSEDDTLITSRHIEAFLEVTPSLRTDEVAGFLRSEEAPDGTTYYSTIHRHYRWDPSSVRRRGNDTFAFFSNEHAACYLLTRDQLGQAIASGGFVVPPHAGRYDMLVSAATDPYTQCGLTKLVCISRIDDFTCKHLTNKYVGRTGLSKTLADLQIAKLLDIGSSGIVVPAPTRVESRLPGTRWAKSCYEPRRDDLLALVPRTATSVLSLGCGWGHTERALIDRGCQVTAVPLDPVIGVLAEREGIRMVERSLDDAHEHLPRGAFDAILISGLLHLTDHPVDLLRRYGTLLTDDGVIVASCPNVAHIAVRLRRAAGDRELRNMPDSARSGVQRASIGRLRTWVQSAGLEARRIETRCTGRWERYDRLTLGLCRGVLADDIAVVAGRGA